jgi:hypothetical protein
MYSLPGAAGGPQTQAMEHNAPERPAWRAWTIWPPCVLGAAWSVLAAWAALVIGALSGAEDGGPLTSEGWVVANFLGQVIMILASVALLAAGIRPAWRRRAAMAAWLIIPLSAGWWALTLTLSSS